MKTYYVDVFAKTTYLVDANGPAEAMEIVRNGNGIEVDYETQEYVVEEKQDA